MITQNRTRLRGSHRAVLTVALQVTVLGAVIWLLVVPQVAKSMHSFPLLFDIDNSWLPAALVAELLSLLSYALATFCMLRARHRPRFRDVLQVDLSSIALGHCLPDGGAAGTALSWRLLTRAGVPGAEAGVAKLAQGLTSTIVLQALVVSAICLGFFTTRFSSWSVLPLVAGVAILCSTTATLALTRSARVRGGTRRVVGRVPRVGAVLLNWCDKCVHSGIGDAVRAINDQPRRVALAGSSSAANWAFDAIALWASLRAYGAGVSLEVLAVCFSLTTLAAWVPLAPSGLGLADGLMIPALIAFGSARAPAVLGVLTWRVLAYAMPIPLGLVAYGSVRRRLPMPVRTTD